MLREVAGNLSFGLQYLQRDTTARFLSHFDPQTGLAKRSLFCERVQRLLASACVTGARHAVVVMDIERLSVINDSFRPPDGRSAAAAGGGAPEAPLSEDRPGRAFQWRHVRADRAAGGAHQEEIRAAAHRQTQALFGEPFVIDGRTIPVAIHTGFAMSPDDGTDATTLVQNAEAALRYARGGGRGA